MFDGLKKKFSNFVDSLAKKEKEEIKEQEVKEASEPALVKEEPKEEAEVEEEEKMQVTPPEKPTPKIEKAKEESKKSDVKITFGTKLKSKIFGEVKVSQKDVDPFIEQLKTALLESDVNYDVAEKLTESMQKNLVGKAINSKNVEKEIMGVIRESILGILASGSNTDLVKLAQEKKAKGESPFKVMFIGPNGAGKTTTIAKIGNMYLKNGMSCTFSASDTFRAAAIEQTAIHAKRLGVDVIKGRYGADPASIAFDAIAHAKAHNMDVVLIDTAGRQETNKSLLDEVKKMVRVAKPDIKIFVGESIAGNSLLEQVKEFNETVQLDGIILTKLDFDAKGGNTISILSETKIPILFFGTGEKYEDLLPYKPEFIVDNILPNN